MPIGRVGPLTGQRRRRRLVVTVVGARPQFVKAAPLSRALRRHVHEVLVHTGQHYDPELSQAFFEQLGIPEPWRHLGVGSWSHGRMTGRMLEALEAAMLELRPSLVIVLGDTNSTLAGALAAVKLRIPVAHVEAGLRSHDPGMPEEINRRLTDHASTLLFCPSASAAAQLRSEGIRRGVHRVGDVMVDAIQQNLERSKRRASGLPELPRDFYLATLHRQENVDDPDRLRPLLGALSRLTRPVLLPLHPRTRRRMEEFALRPSGALRPLPPVPYLEMLQLVSRARLVLTDSGGLQKEAFVLGTPCVTLRDRTEWIETVRAGANRLVGASPARIARAVAAFDRRPPRWSVGRVYGDGHAARRIAEIVADYLRQRGAGRG